MKSNIIYLLGNKIPRRTCYNSLLVILGDSPACQHEVGHQKGGHFFCWSCFLHASRSSDLAHSYNFPYISMKEHKEIALNSVPAKEAARDLKLNYFSQLAQGEIINELHQRGAKFHSNSNKNHLEGILIDTMKGVHRVPSVFFSQPLASYQDLNLNHYECLPCEPLHCIANHIKNLYEELPHHLEKNEKKSWMTLLKLLFQEKKQKRELTTD